MNPQWAGVVTSEPLTCPTSHALQSFPRLRLCSFRRLSAPTFMRPSGACHSAHYGCGLLLPTAEFVCATLLPTAGTWALCQSDVRRSRRASPGGPTDTLSFAFQLTPSCLRYSCRNGASKSPSICRRFRSIANGRPAGVLRLVNYGPGHPGFGCGRWIRTIDLRGYEPRALPAAPPRQTFSAIPAFTAETRCFVLLHYRSHPSLCETRDTACTFFFIRHRPR